MMHSSGFSMFFLFILTTWAFLFGNALPTPYRSKVRSIVQRGSTDSTTTLSPKEVDSQLLRPALFSRLVYCASDKVVDESCGPTCDALSTGGYAAGNGTGGVEILISGGDQGAIPRYFVAHDTESNTVVVAHQGTDPDNILSILNDAEFLLTDINTKRIASAEGKDVKVHSGFQDTFERTADDVLATVLQAVTDTGATKVLATGHSLGGAIAAFDALMLKDALPNDVDVQFVSFGLPRVGNDEFANFIDASLGDALVRVTNQNDIVPHLPPEFVGFAHPAGEVHVDTVDEKSGQATVLACPGRDNESCIDDGDIDLNVGDHGGPYFDGISFGSKECVE